MWGEAPQPPSIWVNNDREDGSNIGVDCQSGGVQISFLFDTVHKFVDKLNKVLNTLNIFLKVRSKHQFSSNTRNLDHSKSSRKLWKTLKKKERSRRKNESKRIESRIKITISTYIIK